MSSLSVRERFMLFILVLIAIAGSYYLFFYSPMQDKTAAVQGEMEYLETNIQIVNEKVIKLEKMKKELAALKEEQVIPIADYDNLADTVKEITGKLSGVKSFSLSFDVTTVDGEKIVRRPISVSFEVNNYKEAREVLDAIDNTSFRNLITNVSINKNYQLLSIAERMALQDWDAWLDGVSVSCDVIYYEYMSGNTKTKSKAVDPTDVSEG